MRLTMPPVTTRMGLPALFRPIRLPSDMLRKDIERSLAISGDRVNCYRLRRLDVGSEP